MTGPVRRSAVAGSWYPGEAERLTATVESHLAAVPPGPVPGRLVGLISPHAGMQYSGPVAACAYARVAENEPRTVVLVGPSHFMAFDGVSVWSKGAFETPLGAIPIDEELAAAILQGDGKIRDDPAPHVKEHSLEMQLPFLQRRLPGLRIVPALMGTQARSEVERLVEALVGAVERHPALLVASSDLSHYHPSSEAEVLDRQVIAHVAELDAWGLMGRLEAFRGHACGGGAMVAVMAAAQRLGADRSVILRYADSGDVPNGDKTRVVGYLAAALCAGGEPR
jgi:MEMO1 family protein